MRVTFSALRDGLANVNTVSQQLAEAEWQVSSGMRLHAVSDDPMSAQRAIQDQAQVSTLDTYTQSADSANARLTALDSSLGDVVTQLTQAMTAAQSAQGSAADQTTRNAAATTLQGVAAAIAGDINTQFNGAYLFSGAKSTTPPYSNSSGNWVYQGDATDVKVQISGSQSVTVGLNGQSILQGGDPQDVLTVLGNLATAVATGDSAGMAAGVASLQSAFTRVTNAQTQVGIDESTVSNGTSQLSTLRTAAAAQLSTEQDADMATAMSTMSQAQVAYQASLTAMANAGKTSLIDYLK